MGFLSFLKGTNPKQTKDYQDTIKNPVLQSKVSGYEKQ